MRNRAHRDESLVIGVDAPFGGTWSFGVMGEQLLMSMQDIDGISAVPWHAWPETETDCLAEECRQILQRPPPGSVDLRIRLSHVDGSDCDMQFAVCESDNGFEKFSSNFRDDRYYWVPSTFCYDLALRHVTPERLLLHHHGVDKRVFNRRRQYRDGRFVFLCVASVQHRKGTDLLLRAYNELFKGNEEVALHIKDSPSALRNLNQDGPKIVHDTRRLAYADMQEAIYLGADCFVLPTRGEGFCLPALESLASGVPAIVTGWSGHLDFCTDENSYLLDYRMVDSEQGGVWAEPDFNDLKEKMWHAYKHRDELPEKGLRGFISSREQFDRTKLAREQLVPFLLNRVRTSPARRKPLRRAGVECVERRGKYYLDSRCNGPSQTCVLNAPAAAIWSMCNGQLTGAEIVRSIVDHFGLSRAATEAEVFEVLRQFRESRVVAY